MVYYCLPTLYCFYYIITSISIYIYICYWSIKQKLSEFYGSPWLIIHIIDIDILRILKILWFSIYHYTLSFIHILFSTVHSCSVVLSLSIYIYITYIHYITLRYITLHDITYHTIPYHYITLHYITLLYITLHYITYIHPCMYVCTGWWFQPLW